VFLIPPILIKEEDTLAKINDFYRIIKYTKTPLNCILAYALNRKERIKFRWGFSGNFDWRSTWFFIALADMGWYLYDRDKNFFKFTDGKLKFAVSSLSKVGALIEKPNPYHCFDYRNAVVLDIGAFSGDTLVLFFKWRAKKVIAYEPVAENIKLIKLNTQINKLEDKVTVMPYAVSNRSGYIEFDYDDFGVGFGLKLGKYKIKLPSISVKEVLSRAEEVDIAKVDCEGYEKHLLEVSDIRIPKWIIEVHHAHLLPSLVNYFKNKGFDVYAKQHGNVFTIRAILKRNKTE